jgi:hypothetical protein
VDPAPERAEVRERLHQIERRLAEINARRAELATRPPGRCSPEDLVRAVRAAEEAEAHAQAAHRRALAEHLTAAAVQMARRGRSW